MLNAFAASPLHFTALCGIWKGGAQGSSPKHICIIPPAVT